MKIEKNNPSHWLLLACQALHSILIIIARPFLKKPPIPIVVLYGHQLNGNLAALHNQWQKSKKPFKLYYLSLDPIYSQQLESQNIPVLRCHRMQDMLILAKASAVVSDHGLHLMFPLVRWTDIKFIDVWHGIPFKGFDNGDFRLQHQYDEIWVTSDRIKELYCNKFGFPKSKVKTLGYARTDSLFVRTAPELDYKEKLNIPNHHKIALYAPTWKQDNKGRELFPFDETQHSFLEKLNSLCTGLNTTLLIRSHLNASIEQLTYSHIKYTPQALYPDTEKLLLNADILICDWSSIAFDFLALDRPTLFLDVPAPFKKGYSLDPGYRFGTVVNSMNELMKQLTISLIEPRLYWDSNTIKHQSIIDRLYNPETRGKAAQLQIDRLQTIFRNQPESSQ